MIRSALPWETLREYRIVYQAYQKAINTPL